MKHTPLSRWFSKGKYTILLCMASSFISLAQSSNNRFFSSGSEIIMDVLPENDIFYSHVFDKGSSIYSLALLFQINQSDIFKYNRMNPNLPISEGKIVKIPIDTKKIIQLSPDLLKNKAHLKLYYLVKPKETLYSISKRYFDGSAEYIKKQNALVDNGVNAGQKLFIGYLVFDKSTTPTPTPTSEVATRVTTLNPNVKAAIYKTAETNAAEEENLVSKPTFEVKTISQDLIGYKGNNMGNTSGLYILHNTAPIGTVVDIYFNMRNSTCKAKVVGRIPDGMYKSDAELIVSPTVLRYLGILDQRFMVAMKYSITVEIK